MKNAQRIKQQRNNRGKKEDEKALERVIVEMSCQTFYQRLKFYHPRD